MDFSLGHTLATVHTDEINTYFKTLNPPIAFLAWIDRVVRMCVYLCVWCTRDLEVRVVAMDELLLHPEQPSRDTVVDFETKTLRDAREVILAQGLTAGYASVDKSPHPRLWKLLAHVGSPTLSLT